MIKLLTIHYEDGLTYIRLGKSGWGIRLKKWNVSILKPYKL